MIDPHKYLVPILLGSKNFYPQKGSIYTDGEQNGEGCKKDMRESLTWCSIIMFYYICSYIWYIVNLYVDVGKLPNHLKFRVLLLFILDKFLLYIFIRTVSNGLRFIMLKCLMRFLSYPKIRLPPKSYRIIYIFLKRLISANPSKTWYKMISQSNNSLGLDYSVYLHVGCTYTLKGSRTIFYKVFPSIERELIIIARERARTHLRKTRSLFKCIQEAERILWENVWWSVM